MPQTKKHKKPPAGVEPAGGAFIRRKLQNGRESPWDSEAYPGRRAALRIR